MTSQPVPVRKEQHSLRVLKGKRSVGRPIMAPWMVVTLIAVVGFLGLVFARTSLDRAAFELADLNQQIAEQEAVNLELNLEIARLENPSRIAPLAEELGMVIPLDTKQLLVDLDDAGSYYAGNDRASQ
jgi:cell division protein FtsL